MSRLDTKLGRIAKNEKPISRHIPYTAHVDPFTVMTENGDYVQVLKLQGIPFQTADEGLLDRLHEQRNNLYRNVARGQVAVWTTMIRAKSSEYAGGQFESRFGKKLQARYQERIDSQDLYRNDLYVAIVYRDVSDLKILSSVKRLSKRDKQNNLTTSERALRELKGLVMKFTSSLGHYGVQKLRTYDRGGRLYSEVLEYFGQLINGYRQPIPVSRNAANRVLGTVRLSFGVEAGESRRIQGTEFFGAIGVKEYCALTSPGMLDGLLDLPMEFVLTQSLTFAHKQKSIEKIKLQRNRLVASGDLSYSQIEELDEALDDLSANRIVAGEHNLSLIVYGSSISTLDDNLAEAAAKLGEELVVAREDDGLEPAFWSQLPGNFSYRPRTSLVTSRNFSGFAPFHNHPPGFLTGNHWGDALITFKTTSNTPYHFSFHRREKGMPAGNGTIVGVTGTGKTVVMGMMLALAEKFQARRVFFDKDQGGALLINALGGNYTTFRKGERTGLNPLQMLPTKENLEFLLKLFKRIAELSGGALDLECERKLAASIESTMTQLEPIDRTVSAMVEFLDKTKQDGVYDKLRKWHGTGSKAWIFDNPSDGLNLSSDLLGFDMTDALDEDEIRTPITLYIVHRVKQLITGDTPFVVTFDEGWKYARDPVLANDIEDFYRTIRKQNGVIIFGTNSPKDVTESSIGKVILDQSQWKMFFPNPSAKAEDYVDGMGLSAKELEVIQNLPEKSRCFLLKRGISSVVVQMDLAGMDEELSILSGSTENVAFMNRAIEASGAEPERWIPTFHQMRSQS